MSSTPAKVDPDTGAEFHPVRNRAGWFPFRIEAARTAGTFPSHKQKRGRRQGAPDQVI